jgi:hypothetical protein
MSAFATVLLPSVRSFIVVGGVKMSEQRHELRAGVVAPGSACDQGRLTHISAFNDSGRPTLAHGTFLLLCTRRHASM